MRSKDPSRWNLLIVILIGLAMGVIMAGCSPDLPIAEEPLADVTSVEVLHRGVLCECGCPESPCDCTSCPCKKPAVAERAVRVHDDRPWVHTIFIDGEPVADVKDMRESWKWDRYAKGWEVATSDGELLWIPEEKTYRMKVIWRIEGRQYGAR